VVLNDAAMPADRLSPYRTPALQPPIGCHRNKLACAWHAIRLARRNERMICGHMNLLRLAHLARRFSSRLEVWLIAHGIEVWRSFSPPEQQALRRTKRILCVSDYTRRQLSANCPGLEATQLVIQPNALDPQFEPSPRSRETEPGLILAVSRLNAADAYKGIDHLIAAMPAIRAEFPAARLRIVGDGDDRARLAAIAAAAADGAVEFLGRIDDRELRVQFAACQLFALPSGGEGFGLVYLEAMANGKPCIAANAGGAPEVVDARCGLLVPYGDVPALGRACVAALRQTWAADRIQARAADFSYDVFRRRLAGVG
jgi:glycosyltransferase involved in cell wall biosynthesis